jgi:hypothetical protein
MITGTPFFLQSWYVMRMVLRVPRGTADKNTDSGDSSRWAIPGAQLAMATLRIRLAVPSDAARCAAIYRPAVEDFPASFETEAPGEEEMARRISSTLKTHPWLVAGEQRFWLLGRSPCMGSLACSARR